MGNLDLYFSGNNGVALCPFLARAVSEKASKTGLNEIQSFIISKCLSFSIKLLTLPRIRKISN